MKYLKLLFTDSSFIIRWVVLVFVGLIMIMQGRTQAYQEDMLREVRYKADDLDRLASIRKAIKPKAPVIVKAPIKPDIHYVLEGSSKMSDEFHALINGRVYTTGDPIDDFVVQTITMNSATLVDNRTGEQRVLQFIGPQIVQN